MPQQTSSQQSLAKHVYQFAQNIATQVPVVLASAGNQANFMP